MKNTNGAGKTMSPTTMLFALGQNIRSKRKLLQLSQELLAQKAGLHRTYLSDLERGIRNPSISCIAWIAKALNTTVSEITNAIDVNIIGADAARNANVNHLPINGGRLTT